MVVLPETRRGEREVSTHIVCVCVQKIADIYSALCVDLLLRQKRGARVAHVTKGTNSSSTTTFQTTAPLLPEVVLLSGWLYNSGQTCTAPTANSPCPPPSSARPYPSPSSCPCPSSCRPALRWQPAHTAHVLPAHDDGNKNYVSVKLVLVSCLQTLF